MESHQGSWYGYLVPGWWGAAQLVLYAFYCRESGDASRDLMLSHVSVSAAWNLIEDCEMKFGLGKCRGTSWLANLKGHLGWTTRVEQRSCSSCFVTTLHFLSFCTYRTDAGGGNRGRGFLRVANARGGSFAPWRLLLHSWWVSVSLSDFCPSRCFHYS